MCGKSAIGYIIRDSKANTKILGAQSIGCTPILVAEALALKEGVKAALFLGSRKLEIEGDSLGLINALKGCWRVPWKIEFILKEVKQDLLQLDDFRFSHVFREANSVADYMAKKGHDYPSLSRWFESPDPTLFSVIRKDELGWTVYR